MKGKEGIILFLKKHLNNLRNATSVIAERFLRSILIELVTI